SPCSCRAPLPGNRVPGSHDGDGGGASGGDDGGVDGDLAVGVAPVGDDEELGAPLVGGHRAPAVAAVDDLGVGQAHERGVEGLGVEPHQLQQAGGGDRRRHVLDRDRLLLAGGAQRVGAEHAGPGGVDVAGEHDHVPDVVGGDVV